MKWLFFLLLAINILAQDSLVKGERDEFTGNTIYRPELTSSFTGLSLSFLLSKDSILTPLVIEFNYNEDYSIDFDKATVLTNGHTYNFSFQWSRGKREGRYREGYRYFLEDLKGGPEMISDIVKTGQARIRYEGKYRHDFDLHHMSVTYIRLYYYFHLLLQQKYPVDSLMLETKRESHSEVTGSNEVKDESILSKILLSVGILALVGFVFYRLLSSKKRRKNEDIQNS